MKCKYLFVAAFAAAIPTLSSAATVVVDGTIVPTLEAGYALLDRADNDDDILNITADITSAGLYVDGNGATSDSLTINGNGNIIRFTDETSALSGGTRSLIAIDVAPEMDVFFNDMVIALDYASSATITSTNGILVDEAGVYPTNSTVEFTAVDFRLTDESNNIIPVGSNPVGSYGVAFGGGWFSTPAGDGSANFNLINCSIVTKHPLNGGAASGWEYYVDGASSLIDGCEFFSYGPDDASGGADSIFFSGANGSAVTIQNTTMTSDEFGINSSSGVGNGTNVTILDNVTVENCGLVGVVAEEGTWTVTNSSFIGNGEEGFKTTDGTTIIAEITDSIFCSNGFWGIEFNEVDSSTNPVISGCLFNQNGSDAGHPGHFRTGDTNAGAATISFVDCTFNDAVDAAATAIAIASADVTADVDGCVFVGDAGESAVSVTGAGSAATVDDSAVVTMSNGDGTFTNIFTDDPAFKNTNCPTDVDSFVIQDSGYLSAGTAGGPLTGFASIDNSSVQEWQLLK